MTVNEDPTEKLIRELKEENESLMKMLKAAQSGEVEMSEEGILRSSNYFLMGREKK